MKRPYKIGDWFRVPLPGAYDAIGIITHACRSRLFGYFFPVEAAHTPSFDELKSLQVTDAVGCALFGGAGLEEARWTPIATSLAFDSEAWPFPQFASRGAFGRTWSRITYDPRTMSVVLREPLSSSQTTGLPDARFATPEDLESFLQSRIAGETPEIPVVVCEVRSPVDFEQLALLVSRGGRVQFSEALDLGDTQRLGGFIAAHPHVEVRVHGLPRFDMRELRSITALRSLLLDVGTLEHPKALQTLQNLESLRVGSLDMYTELDALLSLPELHRLELHGAHADMRTAMRLCGLRTLVLIDSPPLDFSQLQSASRLRSLTIAHAQWTVNDLSALTTLERLVLRDLQLTALPDLSHNMELHAVELRNVRLLRDLSPLASAPGIRDLRIEGMPQLHVSDFEPLRNHGALRSVTIDIASKPKAREAYRLLRARSVTA
jgi:hypothetical protein